MARCYLPVLIMWRSIVMGYMDEELWEILEIKAKEEDNNFLIKQAPNDL